MKCWIKKALHCYTEKPRSNEQGFYHIYSKMSGIFHLPDTCNHPAGNNAREEIAGNP